MIDSTLAVIKRLNDPDVFAWVGGIFVISYYATSLGFISREGVANYQGFWSKNGFFDRATSFIWTLFAIGLIGSSVDLLLRNQLSLSLLAIYYVLFLFFFAFIYNLVAWHYPGSISNLKPGWDGEIQCLVMSVSMMTGSGHSVALPASTKTDIIAAVQSLLGLIFVAVFIAKAVSAVSSPSA